jgi:D-beta-D-heptose 7-phosphate kinase/D-beta-D-heptose 1-phosphate adenosyltransferase
MILVIGDSCIDRYVYGKVDRICPEAPVPVFQPDSQRENGGMSANVVANLEALGLNGRLVTNDKKPTKTRFIDTHSGQMLMRQDENDKVQPFLKLEDHHLEATAVIMSDYDKGFMSHEDMDRIASQFDCPIFVDTKKKVGPWLHWATCVKINDKEWKHSGCPEMDNLCVTHGPEGATWKGRTFGPSEVVKVHDVCGAGDTFLAALVASYMRHGFMCDAIRFAVRCSAKVVAMPGVVPVPTEMRKFL